MQRVAFRAILVVSTAAAPLLRLLSETFAYETCARVVLRAHSVDKFLGNRTGAGKLSWLFLRFLGEVNEFVSANWGRMVGNLLRRRKEQCGWRSLPHCLKAGPIAKLRSHDSAQL